eukprot:gb/GECG01015002.1/.p1 GENE.gb/GECG01015002.1/~~gb/GECG01015002.1/.p1  ORF type:complete len:606 (+),score=65.30 gb/GECG01015002.1/:1-1818(+)
MRTAFCGGDSLWSLWIGICVVLLIGSAAALSSSSSTPIQADTDCGRVEGLLNTSTNVASFKGIPYGAPPTGERRWESPTSRKEAGLCWENHVWGAKDYGPYCVQGDPFDSAGQEDCLYLNVWSSNMPPSQVNESQTSLQPVVVFIYGGDLTGGRTNLYPLDYLAEKENIVAVSMNYRLNLFGFLATRELTETSSRGSSGNYGFEDQQLALRWIQRNIEHFGGDPNRVTLLGQSSGGTSIFALLSSPASSGLFHHAISLSGSPNLTMTLVEAEKQNADIPKQLNCLKENDPGATVACMRNKSSDEIKKVVPASWDSTKGLWGFPPSEAAHDPKGLNAAGVAIVDGRVVQTDLLSALEEGTIDVPFIVGTMAQEPDLSPNKVVWGMKKSNFSKLVNDSFSPWGDDVGEHILSAYSKEMETGGPQKAYDSILTDYGVSCGNMEVAMAAARGFRSPVYSYVMSQCPEKPMWNFDIFYQNRFAFHTFELFAAINQYDIYSALLGLPSYTPESCDIQYGKLVRSAWTQLSYDGRLDPDSPSGWLAINDVAGFPSSYNVGVIGNTIDGCHRLPTLSKQQQCVVKARNVNSYKKSTCSWWKSIGFDMRFWWSN